jgi:hypothetical protein
MKTWNPGWWDDTHASTWERVSEALRRDWEQTKYDFGVKGGHYLHQDADATVAQATGQAPIPRDDAPNPPKVIGEWNDVESALGYGYFSHQRLRAKHPTWNDYVEAELRKDWESGPKKPPQSWTEAAPFVRRGWEYIQAAS